jgi:hypothetical protein
VQKCKPNAYPKFTVQITLVKRREFRSITEKILRPQVTQDHHVGQKGHIKLSVMQNRLKLCSKNRKY